MNKNENGETLVEHHTKYKEIHGYDETVWITQSEHKLLHHRLRKEGKCNIPPSKLHKIAIAANQRTEKGKRYNKRYKQSDKAKLVQRIYDKNIIQYIDFVETPGTNIQFYEIIRYNYNTGLPNYSARFRGHHGYKLPVIDIDRMGS